MKKQTVIIHPHIKATLNNIDLDLGSELRRYEMYLNSIARHPIKTRESAIAVLESPIDTLQKQEQDEYYHPTVLPPLNHKSSIAVADELDENQTIPVASSLIVKQTSLLDNLLTPWGIFGLILFFAANAFMFVGRDLSQQSTAKANILVNRNPNNEGNLSESNFTPPQANVTLVETIKGNLPNPNMENNLPVITQDTQPPAPPSPLPTIDNEAVIHRDAVSPYPDLKTALLTEIQNYYQPVQLPPPPPITPLEVPTESPTQTTVSKNTSFTNPPSSTEVAEQAPVLPQPQIKHVIVTKYENMDNYAKVKNIVPKAFVSNIEDEMIIQLGAFTSEALAMQYSQQMKNKGLNANVIAISE